MKRIGVTVLILVLASLLLAACAFGPNYTRPDLKLPERFRLAPDDAGRLTLGEMQWWDLYQDPRLRELIGIALTENLDIRLSAARVLESRTALGTSHLQLLPQISANVGASRSKISGDLLRIGQSRMSDTFDGQGNLSYEVDIWGRLRRGTEAARADLLASVYAKRAVTVGLVADVATSYFDLVTLKEELAISQRTVATRLKLVELTKAKHSRGVISGLDVAATEAQLAAARVAIPQQELQIARTEDRLSILLGRYPQGVPSQDLIPAVRTTPIPPAGLPATLLERRPDVQQAEQQLVAANARLGVAKASLLPALSLTGAYGGVSTELSRLFMPSTLAWSASAALLLPLLDPQRSIYQTRGAAARREAAAINFQQTVLRALQEVADALITRSKQTEIEAAQRDQVDALRRASVIAHARYDIGTASYVDVTNADRDLFSAELALATASGDTLLATVQLYRALGGGWQISQKPVQLFDLPANEAR